MSYIKEQYTDQISQQMTLDQVGGMNRSGFVPLPDRSPTPFDDDAIPDELAIDDWFTPQAVQESLDNRIIGQGAAKKAASMIIYSLYEFENTSTSLFIGETGCGKTEIWRILSQEWRGMIQIADASQITAEGWKGGVKMTNLLMSFQEDKAWKKHILVLDEFDKIWDERNSDVNYFDLIQDQMLKIFDHDSSIMPGIDPSDISIVCLGAFSPIFEKKRSKKAPIGFGCTQREAPSNIVTSEDLIEFGMKPELVSRFSRVIQMDPPSLATYRQLADMELQKLEEKLRKHIEIDPEQLDMLSSEALDAGLGGRYIKNRLFVMAEDFIYENPFAKVIDLSEGSVMPSMMA